MGRAGAVSQDTAQDLAQGLAQGHAQNLAQDTAQDLARAANGVDAETAQADTTPAGLSVKPWIAAITPYKGGEGKLAGRDRVIKLSSNENPLGPSPRAVDAYRRAADDLSVYPDGAAAALRETLAGAHALDADRIVCGAGSDEVISLTTRALCGPGDEIIHTEFAFSMYRIFAETAGATAVSVPEQALTADPEAILRAVTPRTKVIFLANPNNPTGTYLDRGALTDLAERTPPHVLLVIDGAYAEYMRRGDYEPGFALADRLPNVAVTRTFSKIHGLAALRLGWIYAPRALADALNVLRGPFNVPGPALAAGEAAMRDPDFVEASAIQNEVWRDWLIKELRECGVETPDSFGNFILPNFGEQGPASAAAVDGYLRANGVIVRRMEGYGLPGRLRISVGAAAENQAVARALRDFLGGSGPAA
ncbi:MAG: histidinol-phosphate transaminase [Pseudomonadota bacterium]